jgi:hypothetical protein
LSLRAFTFAKDLDEGYFDPDFYGITEIALGGLWESGRWTLQLDTIPGIQKVTTQGILAGTLRASARGGYRLAPGREIFLSAAYSSTGLHSFSTLSSDYKYTAVGVGLNWVH